MYYETDGGEEFILTSVILVDPITGSAGREYYNVHLSGGQHVTIKDAVKPRASFIVDWKSANI